MRYIDCFNHFFPKGIWDKMLSTPGAVADIGARMRGIPAIYDLDRRKEVVDMFRNKHNYSQVISLGMPPLEALGEPAAVEEFAKLGNDGMAELCAKMPDYFCGCLASLPMNSPNAAKEFERVIKNGANGLQLHTNINGKPLDEEEFRPIFEVAEKYNKPVFLHPSRTASMPDYPGEKKSKYEIWWTFGWPYETSTAMARLVFGGVMDAYPNLKVLAHHLGAMVPYFEGRVGPGWDQLGNRTTDEDYKSLLKSMKKRPLDYFKDFYADSAVFGSKAATECGLSFYGADRVLFASDCPFDPEKGPGYIRDTIAILESLEMSQADREKINYKNAQLLLGVK